MTGHVDPGTASVVHVAGPPLELSDDGHRLLASSRIINNGGRRAQRCVWCGTDLIALLTPPLLVSPTIPMVPWVRAGAIVRFAKRGDGSQSGVIGDIAKDPLPLDFCGYQVPADADAI